MDSRVVYGWLADLADFAPPPASPLISTKRCAINLDIDNDNDKTTSPSSPKRRRRVPFASIDPNTLRTMQTRRSPRKGQPLAPRHRPPPQETAAAAASTADNAVLTEDATARREDDDVFWSDVVEAHSTPNNPNTHETTPGTGEPDIHETPRASHSSRHYTRQLSQRSLSTAHSLPASSAETTSSRARSTSPVKRPDDLLRLEKPVRWTRLSAGELQARVRETGSDDAARLLSALLRKTQSRKAYLPNQLREDLQELLGLAEDDADKFADRAPLSLDGAELARQMAKGRRLLRRNRGGSGNAPSEEDLAHFARVQEPLERELESLEAIVDHTGDFKTTPHAEAAWNETIHGPMLELAASWQPGVGFENVTRANIAKPFLPRAASTAARLPNASAAGKMIDYAMVLQDWGATGTGHDSIRVFVDGLEHAFFNQSSYSPLRSHPTGLFVETKADGPNGWSEAKAQLGLWLAAWFKRVAAFGIPPQSVSSPPSSATLPFMPLVLVIGDRWELHLGFENADNIEVCGGLDIGGTGDLNSAYLLLDVLRLLAREWIAGVFQKWVANVVGSDGADLPYTPDS
ncbi:hypothetical protein GGR56DRAFT_160531 [Xylariaceae sp. FL0804]|nr:hypothetical protein GGR56DRAFT_160531 [Xylariaceae sp. FL0804]